MFNYAQIRNGKCVGVQTSDREIISDDLISIPNYDESLLFKSYDPETNTFYGESNQNQDSWIITVGALFDRFGESALDILSSDLPPVKAVVLNCTVREYIDLKNPSLAAGMDILISNGFEINKISILNTPAQYKEIPGH